MDRWDQVVGVRDRGTVWVATGVSVTLVAVLMYSCASSAPGEDVGPVPSLAPAPATGIARADCTVSEILVPSCGAWLGVAPNAFSAQPKTEALSDFEQRVGAPVDIFHAYHAAEDLFPTPEEIAVAREPGRPRLLLLNWKPEGALSWAAVADGAADAQIDRQAAYLLSTYRDPFFLAIHHEPEDEVDPNPNSGFTATDYAAMYRYVVLRLRAAGVSNAVSVLNYMGSSIYAVEPWFVELYPGDDVVDWMAWDPYACPNPVKPCGDYAETLNRRHLPDDPWPGFYNWAVQAHPDKPLMLAEWGAFFQAEDPQQQADFFDSVVRQFPFFPQIKALVYFDSAQAPRGATSIDRSEAGLAAFRRLVSAAYFAQRVP